MYPIFETPPPLRGRALLVVSIICVVLVLLGAAFMFIFNPDHEGSGSVALAGVVLAVVMFPLAYRDIRKKKQAQVKTQQQTKPKS